MNDHDTAANGDSHDTTPLPAAGPAATDPSSPAAPRQWSTRALVAAGIAAVVLGLGAGAAIGTVGGDSDSGRGGFGHQRPGQGGPGQGGPGQGGPGQPPNGQQPDQRAPDTSKGGSDATDSSTT